MCPTVSDTSSAHPGYPGLKGCKTVVVVVPISVTLGSWQSHVSKIQIVEYC